MSARLDSYSWRVTNNTVRPIRNISMPRCYSCDGSTIGKFGEQCRACGGKGFVEKLGDRVNTKFYRKTSQ